ncbi:autophagy-related protein 2 [Zygosaccharomyces rouxii]|nr:autophagy-related protein 2 [Zygosaccharomyces rouxii]
MAFWLPQTIQKRLLFHVLQQVSVFSNVDLSNLHVSLGSSSQFSFDDLDLAVEELNIPGFDVKSGKVGHLDLKLNVSGGVGVNGKSLEFVVKPKLSRKESESGTFSLAKSIHDLTNSIIQFADTNQPGTSGNNSNNSNDTGEDINSEILNSPTTTSSSSSVSSKEEIEAAPAVSTLESVRNRILNVALSKLMITFEDISFKILFEDEEIIDIKLEKVFLNTVENNVRRIKVHNLSVHKRKKVSDVPSTRNMAHSLYHSQAEPASLYMSAMESQEKEGGDTSDNSVGSGSSDEQWESGKELLFVNSIDISFEGLSSIDDLGLKDLLVNIDTVRISVDDILDLNESVLDLVVKTIFKGQSEKTPQPSTLSGYRRFQREQDILEGIAFLAVKANLIRIDFAQDFSLCFKTVNLDSLGNKEYVITIDSFEFKGGGLSSNHTTAPIIRGVIKPNESRFSLLHDINVSLTIPALSELFAFSQRICDFVSLLENKIVKKGLARPKSPAQEQRILTGTRFITIALHMDGYELLLKIENVGSNTASDVFKTNSIKILRKKEDHYDLLLNLLGVSIAVSKSRMQLNFFDENLEESLLTSKTFCGIKEVIVEDEFSRLKDLIEDLKQLAPSFHIQDQTKNKERKNSYLKRSVRILHSSNIIYKNTAAASFALIIDSINFKVKNFLKPHFGILDGRFSNIALAATEEGNLVAFSKQISLERLFAKESQVILKPITQMKSDKPIFYFQRKSSGRLRVTLRNVELYYYAKWLDFLKDPKGAGSEGMGDHKDSTHSSHSWELKLVDSSIFLIPYRLSAALVVVIDRFTMSGKAPVFQSKGLLNSGTLLLIDDFSTVKRQENKERPSLVSYYAHQGFSAIGKLETTSLNVQLYKGVISLGIKLHSLALSLCADSAHTMVQLCIDLKLPLTFPDEKKYNYNNEDLVDVFKDVDLEFFNSSHIKHENDHDVGGRDNLIVIENSFIDGEHAHDVENDADPIESIDEAANDSSSDFTNQTITLQEGYLDSAREEESLDLEDDKNEAEIQLDLEVGKITLKLFDGYDWKYTRKSISLTIDQVDREIKAVGNGHQGEGRVESAVFDSIYVSANTADHVNLRKRVSEEVQGEQKASAFSKKANLHPSRFYKALVLLEKLKLSFIGYRVDNPSKEESDWSTDLLNKCDVSVQKFEVVDNVPTSTWNKFLTLSRHEQWPRDRPIFSAQLSTVRPIDFLMATELIVNLEIAPLRLHVDQDALDFLVKFGEFKDRRFELIDEYPDTIFFQKFNTNSVRLKLDYKPKKVDYAGLRSGHTSELMNFFILEGAKLTLKGVVLYGVNGGPELMTNLKAVWAPDIASKQLPGVLEGFAPVKSIAALGSGVKALVTVPLSEYRQDRRFGKSLKNGCNVFLKTTTGDFVKIGVKLASGTQTILENTEEIFGGSGADGRIPRTDDQVVDMETLLQEDQLVGGSNPKIRGQNPAALVIDPSKNDGGQPKIVSLYADQPLDLHKGLEEAYLSLEKHIHLVYDVVWKTKGEIKDTQAGTAAAAVTVAKVAPVAIIRPLIGATEAVVRTLQGISNQFDKDQINNLNDKYKSHSSDE